MPRKSKIKIAGGSCGCNKKLIGGCSNCGLIGGCACMETQQGGFSLNELSVPFLLLAAKIGIQKFNKKKILKGGNNLKKNTLKNSRRRDIF